MSIIAGGWGGGGPPFVSMVEWVGVGVSTLCADDSNGGWGVSTLYVDAVAEGGGVGWGGVGCL